jgi:hypothetical protein
VENLITVECTNPDDMRLRVTAEMSIGEWRQVLARMAEAKHYAPLDEFLSRVQFGIAAVEQREDIRYAAIRDSQWKEVEL